MTREGIAVENVFSGARTTVLSAAEAAQWSKQESDAWVADKRR